MQAVQVRVLLLHLAASTKEQSASKAHCMHAPVAVSQIGVDGKRAH